MWLEGDIWVSLDDAIRQSIATGIAASSLSESVKADILAAEEPTVALLVYAGFTFNGADIEEGYTVVTFGYQAEWTTQLDAITLLLDAKAGIVGQLYDTTDPDFEEFVSDPYLEWDTSPGE